MNYQHILHNSRGRMRSLATTCFTSLTLVLGVTFSAEAKSPVTSDNFEIELIKNYSLGYWDRDSGARENLVVLKPRPSDGFYSFGHVPMDNYDVIQNPYDTDADWPSLITENLPYTITLRPKAGKEHLLEKAIRFDPVWSDAGSGGRVDGHFFVPICPEGYSALGGLATSLKSVRADDDNETGNFRCISDLVLESASWSPKAVWTDSGSGADKDGSLWRADYNRPPKHSEMIVKPNAGFPSGSHDAPRQTPKVIRFKFSDSTGNLIGKLDAKKSKELTDALPTFSENYSAEFANYTDTGVQSTYDLPFVLVNDPEMDQLNQWAKGAKYEAVRTVKWHPVASYDATGQQCVAWDEADDVGYSFSEGLTNETTWNNNVGVEVGVELTGGFKPLGVGGEAAVSVTGSYSHDFGGSESSSSEKGKNETLKRIPGTFLGVFEERSAYKIYRLDGDKRKKIRETDEDGIFKHKFVPIRYVPKGWTKDNPCLEQSTAANLSASNEGISSTESAYDGVLENEVNYDTVEDVNKSQMDEKGNFHLLDAGHTLVMGNKHWSKSKNHYLVFEDRGDLVVYTKDNKFVWGMREQIADKGHVAKVIYQHDGNLAAYDANDGYMWSALHTASPKGTELHLTDSGLLQIVHPDGTIAWTSAE